MSVSDAITALGIAYPNRHFDEKTAELYGRMLRDLDPQAVERAVERLLKGSEFLPTIHAIRQEVAEETLNLPTPEEAWDIALEGSLKNAAPEVQAAVHAVGGRWNILHSDNPTTVRAQFLKSYVERRRNTVTEFMGAKTPLGLPAAKEAIGPTMKELPESERAFAPPVDARWLRRFMGQEVGEPTEAEKAHAIEILREGPPDYGEPGNVYLEAERIFHEAGQ